MTCDIVPYLIVIDTQFIKIFTFDLIRSHNRETNENQDIENKTSEISQSDFNLEEGELKEELAMMDELADKDPSNMESSFSQSMSNNPMKFMMTYKQNCSNKNMHQDLSLTELQIRAKVQFYGDLKVKDPKLFALNHPFERQWYSSHDKNFIK